MRALVLGLFAWSVSIVAQANEDVVFHGRVSGTPSAFESVLRSLQHEEAWDTTGWSLGDLARELQKAAGCRVILDHDALAEIEESSESTLPALQLRVSAKSLLSHILRESEFAWLIRNGRVEITTKDEAEEYLYTHIFPVSDLLASPVATFVPYEYETLSRLITTTVLPSKWGMATGPSSIRGVCGALVFSETLEIGLGTRELLDTLLVIKRLQADNASAMVVSYDLPGTAGVRAALTVPITVPSQKLTLKDAVGKLGLAAGVSVLVDTNALEAASLDTRQLVQIESQDEPLSAVLERTVAQADATWTVLDEAVVVTTRAEAHPITRIYPLRAILANRRGPERPEVITSGPRSPDSLVDVLAETPGVAEGLSVVEINDNLNALVVAHTWEGHLSVEAVLRQLRAAPQD